MAKTSDTRAAREARLAARLRDNLRRRKRAAKPAVVPPNRADDAPGEPSA